MKPNSIEITSMAEHPIMAIITNPSVAYPPSPPVGIVLASAYAKAKQIPTKQSIANDATETLGDRTVEFVNTLCED